MIYPRFSYLPNLGAKALQLLLLVGIMSCSSSNKVKTAKRKLKREFRAVWLTTFDHMDFPKEKGAHPDVHKQELIKLLDFHHKNGINAIFFQVRPAADAFYHSKIELWSQWLTGKQGQAPEPFWDPLAFLVAECHQRNMELHAWINPYRAVYNTKHDATSPNHITKRRPEWFVVYGKHKQFNPGIPAVRQYLTNIVADIAQRYDIDGIHFDDYFYPYKKGKLEFPDQATFMKYGGNSKDVHHWRRNNVDLLIEGVHDTLQTIKPYLKFGISPFGVWRNKSEDPDGSDTHVGQTSYDYLYADVLKWLRKGWIDYLVPQLYWSIEHPRASFKSLSFWWAKHAYSRHIYIGHAFYKIKNDRDDRWKHVSELPNQVRLTRQYRNLLGNAYFRSNFLQKNPAKITDTLRQQLYKYPALIPTMSWKNRQPPEVPQNVYMVRASSKVSIKWTAPPRALDGDTATYYVVYRFPAETKPDYSQPQYIQKITRKTLYSEPLNPKSRLRYRYAVSAVDRFHNESKAVEVN